MRRLNPSLSARFAAPLVLLALALPLKALETSTPEQSRARQTGTLDQPSLKPLFLFDMRGRRDPFMAYPLLTLLGPAGVDISGLQFSGMLQVRGGSVSLFTDADGKSYILRGGVLYDSQDRPVPGVRGGVVEGAGSGTYQVALSQGEHKLTFSYHRQSKRLDASGQP